MNVKDIRTAIAGALMQFDLKEKNPELFEEKVLIDLGTLALETAEYKAGRTLSAANIAKLKEAIKVLNDLLLAAEPPPDKPDSDAEEGSDKKDAKGVMDPTRDKPDHAMCDHSKPAGRPAPAKPDGTTVPPASPGTSEPFLTKEQIEALLSEMRKLLEEKAHGRGALTVKQRMAQELAARNKK